MRNRYYKAGLSYLKGGNREKALWALEEIEDVKPNHPLIAKLLKNIYSNANEGEKKANKQNEREGKGEVNSATGTGWVLSQGFIATAAHVISDVSNIYVIFDGKKYEATVLALDKANDIAVLEVPNRKIWPPGIPIADGSPQLGEDVFTLGFPHPDVMGVNIKLTSGEVSSLTGLGDDPRYLQISVPVQAGNSGGPLLNGNGEVVGIIEAKLNSLGMVALTGDLTENANYALKIQYIIPLIESIPHISKEGEAEVKEHIQEISKSVLLVYAEHRP